MILLHNEKKNTENSTSEYICKLETTVIIISEK